MDGKITSVALSVCVLAALHSGCGREEASVVAMDRETAAAYAAVPEPETGAKTPGDWSRLAAIAPSAAKTAPFIPRDGSAKAVFLAPGAVELPCLFSRIRNDRACWDFAMKADMSGEDGIAFDFWCGDVTQFSGFSFYFKCGDGWRETEFSPMQERAWHKIRIFKSRTRPVGGCTNGWETVGGIRICGWRGGTNDTQLAIANLSFAAAPAKETAEEAAKREKRDREWAAAQPSRKGEWRAFWCHSPYGLGKGRTWDDAIRLLRQNGFNAIMPNLAWAGAAFYKSSVLPVSPAVARSGDVLAECLTACRAHGVECHVWNICWNLGHHATKEFKARMAAEGRLQVRFDGTVRDGWLCPSHPENLDMEIRSFAELAAKGVDGVHFDYIRYPDDSYCFCDGCRDRFAIYAGMDSAGWPEIVRTNETAKAKWREFRISNITALVRGAAVRIRRESPGVKISAAVFQNAETNPGSIGQDWASWCREGLLDFVCPMDYRYDSPVAFKGVVFAQKRAIAGSKTLLRPGIGLNCWHDRTRDIRMAIGEIAAVREAGLDGFSIFDLGQRAEILLPVLGTGPTLDTAGGK